MGAERFSRPHACAALAWAAPWLTSARAGQPRKQHFSKSMRACSCGPHARRPVNVHAGSSHAQSFDNTAARPRAAAAKVLGISRRRALRPAVCASCVRPSQHHDTCHAAGWTVGPAGHYHPKRSPASWCPAEHAAWRTLHDCAHLTRSQPLPHCDRFYQGATGTSVCRGHALITAVSSGVLPWLIWGADLRGWVAFGRLRLPCAFCTGAAASATVPGLSQGSYPSSSPCSSPSSSPRQSQYKSQHKSQVAEDCWD
jgi:hypothetical protein